VTLQRRFRKLTQKNALEIEVEGAASDVLVTAAASDVGVKMESSSNFGTYGNKRENKNL
jgi:hypothetical protein